jgi:two-component system, cell cycle sensor histidine kinase and response regulator CckA
MPKSGQGTRKVRTRGPVEKPEPASSPTRHLSDLELRQTAEKYSRMIQSSPDAITLRSLPDRRYIEINEGFTRLTGYSANEVIGKTPAELGIWVERTPHEATLQSLERAGQVHEEEFRFRTKSGEIRHGQLSAVRLVLNGEPVVLSITHDVTNLKRTEEALRRSETDFRSLVEDAPYGIYRVTVEGRLLQVNPALVKMLGYDSEADLLRRNMTTDVFRDPARRVQLLDEHSEKKDFRQVEAEWKRKDGRVITVRLTGRPIRQNGSDLSYFEVFAEDITERRSLERQVVQAQKMDAIGRLAGGVAHDFNNLLAVILGHSELVAERAEADVKLRSSAEAIRKAGERAAALTLQLLTFSRKQVVEPKIIDMNLALTELEKLVRRVLTEDIELTTKLGAELGRIRIDPGQFDQVLMNLVVNARDALRRGGKIVLETSNIELDETYTRQHLGTSPGRYVVLSVSDTGIGMDPETLSHIFEPFFTTKEKGKGTGLGLSTVYGIVNQAGGHVMAYSEPGRGTTMRIYFPRVPAEAATEAPLAPLRAIPRGTETILVVEDETALRELTRGVLENSGYTVIDAADADEAIKTVNGNHSQIALLLTDVVMPRTSGTELADRLKKLRPDLKVLFMSGYSDDVIAHRGILENAALIQKPFTKRVLLTRVRDLLDS